MLVRSSFHRAGSRNDDGICTRDEVSTTRTRRPTTLGPPTTRAASLATTLPRIFDLSFKAISTIVLASFLLVDLGSPQFEAILFAVLACSFYLLESFVDDLEDPFGGSWTVDAALDACDELVDALAVEE